MLPYILFKTQSMLLSETSRQGQPDADLQTVQTQTMLLSATSREGQPDADLHPVQNPGHAYVSNKEEGPARCQPTSCSKPRVCLYQQQGGRANQMLTYILFKSQSILLSATSRERLDASRLTHYLLCLRVCSCQHPSDQFKQNINLHSVYDQTTFLLTSSWDQVDIGLLSV